MRSPSQQLTVSRQLRLRTVPLGSVRGSGLTGKSGWLAASTTAKHGQPQHPYFFRVELLCRVASPALAHWAMAVGYSVLPEFILPNLQMTDSPGIRPCMFRAAITLVRAAT